MDPVEAGNIAASAGGRLEGDPSVRVAAAGTDTRSLERGAMYVALRGERHDGHAFVGEAVAAGAAAVMVERPGLGAAHGVPSVVVEDCYAGLSRWAAAHRAGLPVEVVGVTGSNGKTSAKDLAAAVLAAAGPTRKTRGNLNNHIGVPLTLLGLGGADRFAVVEMGMNHPGEIAPLAAMARPRFGIITGIGTAHIEFMGSREAIALEKGMLAEALPADGVLALPDDDPFADGLAARTSARVIRCGIGRGEVRAEQLEMGWGGSEFDLAIAGERHRARIPVAGAHMVRNALLAAAVGWGAGLTPAEVAAALSSAEMTAGRLQVREIRGVTFLDDTYNANPDSVRAALETLAAVGMGGGRRYAVLGEMREMGAFAEAGHREVGDAAVRAGMDGLIAVGAGAEWILQGARGLGRAERAESCEAAAEILGGWVVPGDAVVVKGSRGARMERVLAAYAALAGEAAP
jgi:UDP-N-acetylmuramoyl-tripeptide--D-alanyl-D-alanine ligase